MFSRRKRKKLKKLLSFAKDEWFFKVNLMLDDFKKLQEKVKFLPDRLYRLEDTVATHCQTIPHLSEFLKKKVEALESELKESDHNFSKFLDLYASRERSYNNRIKILENKNKYKEAYYILMEYWDSLPDEEKPDIDRRLKKLGI